MITVQGVADCIFEENGGLYILDYKTDYTDRIETLGELYGDQLRLYKKLLALSMAERPPGFSSGPSTSAGTCGGINPTPRRPLCLPGFQILVG